MNVEMVQRPSKRTNGSNANYSSCQSTMAFSNFRTKNTISLPSAVHPQHSNANSLRTSAFREYIYITILLCQIKSMQRQQEMN